jgi:hypothetical protein
MPTSKLSLHKDRILSWREAQLTYAHIQSLLLQNHGLSITQRQIKSFVAQFSTPAPRISKANLNPYRTLITEWLCGEKLSTVAVLERLREHDEIFRTMSKRTLERTLKDWSVHRQKPINDPVVRLRIISLYFNELCSDKDIAEDLRHSGYDVDSSDVAGVRKQMKLFRRTSNENWQSEEPRFRALVEDELAKGQITLLGRGMVYTQIRSEGYNVSRQACIHLLARKLANRGQRSSLYSRERAESPER